MRTFVIGDIHGAFPAMLQCFERSGFDYQNDRLIQLGDIADRHPQVYECVEELLKIKNLVAIRGNHDEWLRGFIQTEYHPFLWNHGGKETLISYLDHAGKSGSYFAKGNGFKTGLVANDIPFSHIRFFKDQVNYFIDEAGRCFVHAGFKRFIPFADQKQEDFYWDRSLWADAVDAEINKTDFKIQEDFKEIFIGHTPTINFGTDKPMKALNIYNVDTGAGHSGRLTIMEKHSGSPIRCLIFILRYSSCRSNFYRQSTLTAY